MKLVKVNASQRTERLFLIEEDNEIQSKIEQWNEQTPITEIQIQNLAEFDFSPGEPHILIEWSPRYQGQGEDWDENRESEFAYIPERLCKSIGRTDAFALYTGIDPVHIISEGFDELFDSEGNEIE